MEKLTSTINVGDVIMFTPLNNVPPFNSFYQDEQVEKTIEQWLLLTLSVMLLLRSYKQMLNFHIGRHSNQAHQSWKSERDDYSQIHKNSARLDAQWLSIIL